MSIKRIASAGLALALLSSAAFAAPKGDAASHDQALEVLKRGIAFRTVAGAGQTVAYADYLKSVLVAGGFKDAEVSIEPLGDTAFLIARYPGKDPSRKPIVVNGHMDVVEARASDWTRDPFTPVIEDGRIYGRGSVDNKFDVSMIVTVLAKLRQEGWKPGRDIVLALSGVEAIANATARSAAGSVVSSPPATLTNTSRPETSTPARRARTARIIARRPASTPNATRRGDP